MADVIKTTFQVKRGTAARWEELNPILNPGEPGFEMGTFKLKIGNGSTPWKELPYVNDVDISKYITIEDIIKELSTPGLDPRDSLEAPILKSDILELKDLKVGMELQGTVRNVTSFGAFVDIGLHDDGLVHISKMAKTFVKDPKEVVNVGDIVTVYVCDVDKDKQKVALSLIPLS